MSYARYIVGDALEVMATLPDASVDLVMSSPPFLALRSYLPADHEHKAKEIGSEATPGEFLDVLLDVVEECARVLAPHGSLVIELGDTYAGSGGAGGDYGPVGLRAGQPGFDGSARRERTPGGDERGSRRLNSGDGPPRRELGPGWPLDKSKVLVPQLFAIALAYGFNPLTGRQTEPWRVRNTVAWCRPNPPVGRDGDKFRPATSFLTVACKARDRYWDGDAVRVAAQDYSPRNGAHMRDGIPGRVDQVSNAADENGHRIMANPAGAPLLDWWEIPTAPYKGSHYATYPPDLVVPVVKAMCPQKVCRVCGKPSTRITSEPTYERTDSDRVPARLTMQDGNRPATGVNQHLRDDGANTSVIRVAETVGWSDCDCHPSPCGALDWHGICSCGPEKWRPGVVLDPFAGSGTTLAVATGHGRDAIGIDLDSRNADLALERIGGLFLEIEHFSAEAVA